MSTWGQIRSELINNPLPDGVIDFDGVRRRYLRQLASFTGRSTIIYETAGFSPPSWATPEDVSISLHPDMAAFMEVVHGLPKDVPIDLIVHSPGGTAEAAEAIVEYLRGRFPGLRVIVPIAAMSAATMMALAADEIVMGAHSQLGPIDPQITISTPDGLRSSPAKAILQQFEKARSDLGSHPQNLPAWLPIIQSMAPALLEVCEDAIKLSKSMVSKWLSTYMFRKHADPAASADRVADALSDYTTFMSHNRRVGADALKQLGVTVLDLEADQRLQDLVLGAHHAVDHLMSMGGIVKIVESHLGRAYIRGRG